VIIASDLASADHVTDYALINYDCRGSDLYVHGWADAAPGGGIAGRS